MKNSRKIVAAVLTSALAAAAIVAGASSATAAAKRYAYEPISQPITYTFAGDSITARDDSWQHQLADPDLVSVGGYAHSGYTSAQILEGVTPHPDADVLVIMVGTNDVTKGVSQPTVCANAVKIAQKVQAGSVFLSFLPPSNVEDDPTLHVNRRAEGITMNRTLVQCAADNGWLYGDPFSMVRAWNNAWGTNNAIADGVHPTTATNVLVTARMDLYIRQAARIGKL